MLQLLLQLRSKLSSVPGGAWIYAALGAVLIATFLLGRCTTPTKTITKTETKTVFQDRVVEKRVEVKSEAVEREKVKVEYLIQHLEPNGASDTVKKTITASASSAVLLQLDADEKAEEKTVVQEKVTTKIVEAEKPNWRVGAFAEIQPLALNKPPTYGGLVCRRLGGPVWLGLMGSSAGYAGVTLQLDF